jgi:dihydrolipoamide dehydrogenase
MEHFDVVILGGGSAGERVAGIVARAGKAVGVVEERLLGGECPFFACMPSKAMLHSATLRRRVASAHDYGAAAHPLDVGDGGEAFRLAAAWRNRVADDQDDSSHVASLEKAGGTLVRGRGAVNTAGNVEVDGRELSFDHLVISTGGRFVMPPVEGLDTVDAWTSEDVYTADERPDSAVILGGGPIGCEVAQVLARFGTRVSIVELEPRLLSDEQPEVTALLAERLQEDGVTLYLGARAESVRKGGEGIVARLADGAELSAQRLVVATGKAPAADGLGLEHLGIEPGEDGSLAIDEACRVRGQTRIWACGDITNIAPFTHTANYQGRIVAENILGGARIADYRSVPRAVYTDPAVASVGMSADQANEAGIDFIVSQGDAWTARGSATGERFGAHVLIADRKRRVLLGASGIGPGVEEYISECGLAIRAEVPLEVLADVVHPFPTHSERYDYLFEDLLRQADGRS